MSQIQYNLLMSNLLKEKHALTSLRANLEGKCCHDLVKQLSHYLYFCHKLHLVISPPFLRQFPQSQSQLKALKKTFR